MIWSACQIGDQSVIGDHVWMSSHSALAGEVNTRNGRLLFVIFNQRGSVARFRNFQNFYVSLVQGQFGGAEAVKYDAMSLETRLARTRISYPDGRRSDDE